MVGDGDEIKVMDFGIARLRETSAATRLTRAGMIMGTPLYMAPEQIEGGEVTEKTDIYAFGIVLYEMLSGVVPFRAPTPAAILMKHLKEIPPPLRKLRGDVPVAVEKVVSRALEKKPERRPATMVEIVESLRSIEARLPRRSGKDIDDDSADGRHPHVKTKNRAVLSAHWSAGSRIAAQRFSGA